MSQNTRGSWVLRLTLKFALGFALCSAQQVPEVPIEQLLKKRTSLVSTSQGGQAKELDVMGNNFPVYLKEVLEEVLSNNPDVIRARLDWMAKKRRLISSWGAFEPDWVASYSRGGFEKASSRYLQETEEYQAGVEGKVPSGGTYRVEFNLTDEKYNNYLSTRPRAFSGVSFKQPLLKGAWFGAPWSEVRLSSIDKNIAHSQYRMEIMKIIADVESAYWALAFAETKYRFATESVDVAEKLVKDAKTRMLAGKLSSMGVVEAEAGLAQRRSYQSDRKRELWEAMNNLKLIVSSKRLVQKGYLSAKDSVRVPEKELNQTDAKLSQDSLTQADLSIQPDWMIQKNVLYKEEVRYSHSKDKLLPELNIDGQIGRYGEGSSGDEALSRWAYYGGVSWSAGVEFRMPVFFGLTSRNEMVAARLQKQNAEKNIQAMEYELKTTYQLLLDRIRSLKAAILDGRKVVAFRKQLLDVELSRFKVGKSNYRLIYEIEEKLAEAKQWELESNINYREAMLQLSRVSGKLLLERGLEKYHKRKLILDPRLQENLGNF